MAPSILTNQARSRLPAKWMQPPQPPATLSETQIQPQSRPRAQSPSRLPKRPTSKSSPIPAQEPSTPIRWSTHTLANEQLEPSLTSDPYDTVRTRSDSNQPYDTFAHRRKSRISDLTCVDHDEEFDQSSYSTPSLATAVDGSASARAPLDSHHETIAKVAGHPSAQVDDGDDDDDDDDLSARINFLMAATMEALEVSNRLVLDTLSSRAKLAQLHAMESTLDSQLDSREASLRRQIQVIDEMSSFVSQKSIALANLVSPAPASLPSLAATEVLPSSNDVSVDTVQGTAAAGIVQALDRDATIGKTAAKRLEKMLQSPTIPSPTSSPNNNAQRRSGAARRAFSITNFGFGQDSIQEEDARSEVDVVPPSSRLSDVDGSLIAAPASPSRTASPVKKRSTSYDSRADGGAKLMARLAGPSRAVSTGYSPSSAAMSSTAAAATPSPLITREEHLDSTANLESEGLRRPSLMAKLRTESVSSGTTSASGLPDGESRRNSRRRSPSPGLPSVSKSNAESTLAALLGMPSVAPPIPPSASSIRTDSPSDSSYFDSATEDSNTSLSPSTPGSIQGIQDVLSKFFVGTRADNSPALSTAPVLTQNGDTIRRASATKRTSSFASPRASLSIDKTTQLSQLTGLQAEQVTWRSSSHNFGEGSSAGRNDSESNPGGISSADGSGAKGSGGGALRALQRLNEMSAAKLAGHDKPNQQSDVAAGTGADAGGEAGGEGSTNREGGSSWYNPRRVSLGLGLPSYR